MLENPLVSGQGYEETYAAVVGECTHCKELVYQGYEGVAFEDEIFCDTSCLTDHLKKSGVIEEI